MWRSLRGAAALRSVSHLVDALSKRGGGVVDVFAPSSGCTACNRPKAARSAFAKSSFLKKNIRSPSRQHVRNSDVRLPWQSVSGRITASVVVASSARSDVLSLRCRSRGGGLVLVQKVLIMGGVVVEDSADFAWSGAAAKADTAVWTRALREAMAAQDKRRYHQTLMRFLSTRQGVTCVDTMLRSASAPAIMRRSFDRLAPAMNLSRAADLARWMRDDARVPAKAADDSANDIASLAVPYLRFARDWASCAIGPARCARTPVTPWPWSWSWCSWSRCSGCAINSSDDGLPSRATPAKRRALKRQTRPNWWQSEIPTECCEARRMDSTNVKRDLEQFDAEVERFEASYDKRAEGKAGIQKGMDVLRALCNRGEDGQGHGDDQWKNVANTQHAVEQIKTGLQNGSIGAQQAEHQLGQLRHSFQGEAQRVNKAQQGNARMGQVVHGAGRIVAVSAAGIAGTVAGGGGNIVTGAAAAVAAGSAYDALTVGAGALDKTTGNGQASASGPPGIAPVLNTNQSLGGLGANTLAGQKIEGQDIVHAATGTALDAVSGFGVGQSVTATRTAVAATQGSVQAAKAAAGVSVKTGLRQSAATLVVQNTGTALDPGLTTPQKLRQIAEQTQGARRDAPAQIVFSALSSGAGMAVQPANKLLDTTAQLGLDGASNLGEASLNNMLAGRGPQLSNEQLVQAGITGGAGAIQNIAQRPAQADAQPQPVTDQELQALHALAAPNLDAVLGAHKHDSLAQTLQGGAIDSTLRPLDARAGTIVMQANDESTAAQPKAPSPTIKTAQGEIRPNADYVLSDADLQRPPGVPQYAGYINNEYYRHAIADAQAGGPMFDVARINFDRRCGMTFDHQHKIAGAQDFQYLMTTSAPELGMSGYGVYNPP
jgi:hypothetical protein